MYAKVLYIFVKLTSNKTDKIIEQLGLLVMVNSILDEGTVVLGTSMDF